MKVDFILIGSILSPDCSKSFKGFISVGGNTILDVREGYPDQALRASASSVIDYKEQLIMPGFHDSHTHVLQGTLNEDSVDLRDADSEEEAAKMLADRNCNSSKSSSWILGGGWDPYRWANSSMPSKATLDKIFKDVPVFLLNKECHGAWLNSKALDLFNINKDTPDPQAGKIYRNPDGTPTGYLHEAAALNLVSLIYDVSDFEHLAIACKFSKKASSFGITAISDMNINGSLKFYGYKEMEERNEMKVRIHFCPSMHEDINRLKYLKKMFDSAKLKFSGAKGFIDGTPTGYTSLLIEEYSDKPGFFGEPVLPPDVLQDIVIKLDKADIRCRLHACGDGAVRLGLNLIENARLQNGPKDTRHTIEHIECMSLKDAARFRELGVVASVQPDHLPKFNFPAHPFHKILGKKRYKEIWPFKSIEACGGLLSFGTDYPVAPLDPLRGIFRAVTRMTDDEDPVETFAPNEKISMQSALRAYTYGSAYCNYRENELGTLEIGKFADITVLSKDLTKCKPQEIKQACVVATIMDGKFTYEK